MERRAPDGGSSRRAPGLWAEALMLLLVLACVGGSLGLVVAMHRRHAADRRKPAGAVAVAKPVPPPPAPKPRPKVEPKSAPEPEPAEDPTPKALAALAELEAQERAAAATADREARSLESARKAALAASAKDRRREAMARAQLKTLEDKVRRLEDEADALARERDALAAEREATKNDLEVARIRAGTPNSFAVLPYKGSNGTWRRPIPIECRDGSATLMPHGPTYGLLDLADDPRTNPLVAAILMAGTRLRRQDSPDGAPIEPYVLFIVRPDGIRPFYEARVRVEALGIPFGYELADADWTIDYPEIGDPSTWVDAAATPGVGRAATTSAPSPFPRGAGGGGEAADRLARGPRPGEIAETVRGATNGWGGFPRGTLDRGGRYINGGDRPGNAAGGPGRSGPTGWGASPSGTMPGPGFRELEAMDGDGPGEGRPSMPRSGAGVAGPVAMGGGGDRWAADGRRPGSGGGGDDLPGSPGDGRPMVGGQAGNATGGPGGRIQGQPGGVPGQAGQGQGQGALPGASGQPAGGSAEGIGQTAGGQGRGNASTSVRPNGANPPADGRGQAAPGAAFGRLRPVPRPVDDEPTGPGDRASGSGRRGGGSGGGGQGDGGGEGSHAAGSRVSMERRPPEPLELVVVCGPDGLTIQPGHQRIKAAELNGKGDPLPRMLRAIANRRQTAAPAVSIRPEVRFLVEPGGQEAYWAARRQTILAGLGWPMSFRVVEGTSPRLLAEESR